MAGTGDSFRRYAFAPNADNSSIGINTTDCQASEEAS